MPNQESEQPLHRRPRTAESMKALLLVGLRSYVKYNKRFPSLTELWETINEELLSPDQQIRTSSNIQIGTFDPATGLKGVAGLSRIAM